MRRIDVNKVSTWASLHNQQLQIRAEVEQMPRHFKSGHSATDDDNVGFPWYIISEGQSGLPHRSSRGLDDYAMPKHLMLAGARDPPMASRENVSQSRTDCVPAKPSTLYLCSGVGAGNHSTVHRPAQLRSRLAES